MNFLSEKHQRIAHVTCEVLVIIAVVIYFNQKIRKINQSTDKLNEEFTTRINNLEILLQQESQKNSILESKLAQQEKLLKQIIYQMQQDSRPSVPPLSPNPPSVSPSHPPNPPTLIPVQSDKKSSTKRVKFSIPPDDITEIKNEEDSDTDEDSGFYIDPYPEKSFNPEPNFLSGNGGVDSENFDLNKNLDELISKIKPIKSSETTELSEPTELTNINTPDTDENNMNSSPEDDMGEELENDDLKKS